MYTPNSSQTYYELSQPENWWFRRRFFALRRFVLTCVCACIIAVVVYFNGTQQNLYWTEISKTDRKSLFNYVIYRPIALMATHTQREREEEKKKRQPRQKGSLKERYLINIMECCNAKQKPFSIRNYQQTLI